MARAERRHHGRPLLRLPNGHRWRPAVSQEGAGVAAGRCSGSAGSSAVVVASSSMAEEARGRRPRATAPATSLTAHGSPEKCGKLLMHQAMKMASTEIAWKRGTSIKVKCPFLGVTKQPASTFVARMDGRPLYLVCFHHCGSLVWSWSCIV
ncbi:hypothetical protein C2845_PM03G31170 [Panicum miliaceum]|uniref:Uncharacterized protein n=1 Tax=Panicum miliaceum TaxID=4540 RepID=A0A3L6T988_PANMI|nr:hypothetical protein C2845_PM03G31170 [Panicum miliaceum]